VPVLQRVELLTIPAVLPMLGTPPATVLRTTAMLTLAMRTTTQMAMQTLELLATRMQMVRPTIAMLLRMQMMVALLIMAALTMPITTATPTQMGRMQVWRPTRTLLATMLLTP
jgi:hypothetical protein